MSNQKLFLITFIWEDGEIMGKLIMKNNNKISIISSINKIMGINYYELNTKEQQFNNNYGQYFDLVNWRRVKYDIESIDTL